MLASKVVEDMRDSSMWRLSGTARFTFPRDTRDTLARVLRVDMQMFTDKPARSGSTIGDSTATLTVSETAPTESVKSTSLTAFKRTGALRTTAWKPASSARTS